MLFLVLMDVASLRSCLLVSSLTVQLTSLMREQNVLPHLRGKKVSKYLFSKWYYSFRRIYGVKLKTDS